jgi:hypothetical protein
MGKVAADLAYFFLFAEKNGLQRCTTPKVDLREEGGVVYHHVTSPHLPTRAKYVL